MRENMRYAHFCKICEIPVSLLSQLIFFSFN